MLGNNNNECLTDVFFLITLSPCGLLGRARGGSEGVGVGWGLGRLGRGRGWASWFDSSLRLSSSTTCNK